MAGKDRSIDYYITRFGVIDGTNKFNECVTRRIARQSRISAETTKAKLIYTNADIVNGDAIMCMACGTITSRLQWTHFKYKCISNIPNSTTYLKLYPTAALVAENLKKETVVTKEKFIKLYGVKMGIDRWDAYLTKQTYSNSYKYKADTHGWDMDTYNSFNKNRAVTLANMIAKHGEDIGLTLWDSYCEKQRHTTTIEYFIDTYGIDVGKDKFSAFDRSRSVSGCGVNGVSTLELDIFDTLNKEVGLPISHNVSILHTRGGPFDMGSIDALKLIEVYGTYWHQDPRKYSATDTIKSGGRTALQQWAHDTRKRDSVISLGYEVFVIWEDDWKKSKTKIINEVIKWWNNGNKTN